MSVTSTSLKKIRCTGSVKGSDDGSVSASFTAMHRARCNDPGDTPDVVLRHFRSNPDLPWIGRPYKFGDGFDASSICRNVTAEYLDKSDGDYNVVCEYEPVSGGGDKPKQTDQNGNETENPLEWHDEIEVTHTQFSAPVWRATFRGFLPPNITNDKLPAGKVTVPIASNMKPFDPGLESTQYIKVIRITKYIPQFREEGEKWLGSINSEPVTIDKPAYNFHEFFGTHQGLIANYGATFGITNKVKFWRHTIEVHITTRVGGWRHVPIDRGVDELYLPEQKRPDGSTISHSDLPPERGFENHPPADEDGTPEVGPFNLNGHGKKLKPTDDPVWLIYSSEDRPEVSFASIRW